jgi:hypothetical protein
LKRRLDEWPHHLVVIGTDGGDPYVLDLSRADADDAPVLKARHGQGSWGFHPVAVSFKEFIKLVVEAQPSEIPTAAHVRLLLETREPTTPLIVLLRRYTGKLMDHLRQSVMPGRPVLDKELHHSEYPVLGELLRELEARSIRYDVEVDGEPESAQYLRNLLQQRNVT